MPWWPRGATLRTADASRCAVSSDRTASAPCLPHAGLRQLEEAPIQSRALGPIGRRGMHGCRRLDAANQAFGFADTLRTDATTRPASQRNCGTFNQPAQHANAVEQQRAIGRIVDSGGDYRAVDAQLGALMSPSGRAPVQ